MFAHKSSGLKLSHMGTACPKFAMAPLDRLCGYYTTLRRSPQKPQRRPMGETVNLVLAQYRSVIGGETCLHLVRREKRSDFEAVLSDWGDNDLRSRRSFPKSYCQAWAAFPRPQQLTNSRMAGRARRSRHQQKNLPTKPDQPPTGDHTVVERQQSITWEGPLPPPKVLKQFGDAVPGAGEIIISEFQKQVPPKISWRLYPIVTKLAG